MIRYKLEDRDIYLCRPRGEEIKDSNLETTRNKQIT